MSLFEDLAKGVLGGQGGAGQGGVSTILEMLQNQPGGLSGLVQNFHQNGLGDVVSSWISTGQNLPVSADQLQSVLGSEQIQAIAQKLGISTGDAGSHLASLLPQIIDGLSPNGQLPQGGDLMSEGMNLLKGFMSRGA